MEAINPLEILRNSFGAFLSAVEALEDTTIRVSKAYKAKQDAAAQVVKAQAVYDEVDTARSTSHDVAREARDNLVRGLQAWD